jgi:hypothetical protein
MSPPGGVKVSAEGQAGERIVGEQREGERDA